MAKQLHCEKLEQRVCLTGLAYISHEFPSEYPLEFVTSGDLDGDGDTDVVASYHEHISWHENLDGRGSFSPPRTITHDFDRAIIHLADLDNDGDFDLIAGHFNDTRLAWYENQDGVGTFGPQRLIADEFATRFVEAFDMDGDGDLDVVTDGSWFENLDGRGDFRLVSTFGRVAAIDDLDGNGYRDIVMRTEEGIVWRSNDGDGSFEFDSQRTIASNERAVDAIQTSDLDGDGDYDVVATTSRLGLGRGDVLLFENVDGQGNFAEPFVVDSATSAVFRLHLADIDRDGDVDILTWPGQNDALHIYLNDGGQLGFSRQVVVVPTMGVAASLTTSDIDSDGDVDIVSSIWFESRLIGDSNDDGQFDSADLVSVFRAGKYEDETAGNATFDEGDWNGDGVFDSRDFVFALQAGTFVFAAEPPCVGVEIKSCLSDDERLRGDWYESNAPFATLFDPLITSF